MPIFENSYWIFNKKITIIFLKSKMAEKRENAEQEEQPEDGSISLDYLQPGEHEEPDDSKQSHEEPSRIGRNNWGEKDSSVRKVTINNRAKEITHELDRSYDGIYLYKPGVELPNLFHLLNQSIKVIISSEYIKKNNPELVRRNIYGTDTYTSNSDCLCIAIHAGYINTASFSSKRYEGIELTCKVTKPKKNYSGSIKNGLLSRSIKGFNGNALKPEAWKPLTSLGQMELLEKYASNMHIPIGKSRVRAKPKNICSIIPIPETHLVFNMNNQPAYKYSIFNLADKGYQKSEFLTKKLDSYVLYLETSNGEKFELTKGISGEYFQVYKLAKLKQPTQYDNEYFYKNKPPVPEAETQIICEDAEWENIFWGNTSMKIKQQTIENLISFKYYKKDGK